MEYLRMLLVSILVFIATEAKLPDFIDACKLKDPELNKCIQNRIHGLRHKLSEGIPELGVGRIDPLQTKILVLNLGPGISVVGRNIQLTGLRNFEVENMVADLKNDTYSFDFTIPKSEARGNCEVEATIGPIPFKGNGPIAMSAKSVFGKAKLQGKKIRHNGKIHYFYPSMELKLKLNDFELSLEHIFENSPEIAMALNKLLNDEKDQVLESITPAFEEVMSKEILNYANTMVKSFTFAELLLES